MHDWRREARCAVPFLLELRVELLQGRLGTSIPIEADRPMPTQIAELKSD